MNVVRIAAAAAALTVLGTMQGAAQERPRVSLSEASGGSSPTCVIGGAATDCGGGVVTGPVSPVLPGAPVLPASVVASPGFPAGTLPGDGGRVGADTDVNRSTRSGTATAR